MEVVETPSLENASLTVHSHDNRLRQAHELKPLEVFARHNGGAKGRAYMKNPSCVNLDSLFRHLIFDTINPQYPNFWLRARQEA